MTFFRLRLCAAAAALVAGSMTPAAASAQTAAGYGPHLEGFSYPYPLQRHTFTSQGQKMTMAYLDVAPKGQANGRTVVLLHGKNFCAATWQSTIDTLSERGFRVIAPEQIGFCASSKPASYQFTFQQLATNTRALLEAKGVQQATVIGHSMGGMLASRYALMFPQATEKLVMVNPIGLEDWQAEGVPYASVDQAYQTELRTSFDTLKQYQLKNYYHGQWKPEYDRWVEMLAGLYAGPGKAQVAWNAALTSDMIFTQPVVHEFPKITVPTVLMIGQLDTSAPGADRAPKDVAQRLGKYPELGKQAARTIPGSTLVEFAELGHSPQVEAPEAFHEALLKQL